MYDRSRLLCIDDSRRCWNSVGNPKDEKRADDRRTEEREMGMLYSHRVLDSRTIRAISV